MTRRVARLASVLLLPAAVAAQEVPAPAPAAPAPRRLAAVQLALTGDVNLGTVTVPDGVPPNDGRGLLDSARAALVGDLVIVNYEGVLADSGADTKCTIPAPRRRRGLRPLPPRRAPNCYAFRGPASLAPRLRESGVTHANLANNHALDFGPAGLAATTAALEAAGLRTYGPDTRITFDTVQAADGATRTVALVGFTTYDFAPDLRNIPASVALVDSVRRLADLVVVTFHGGAEGARALHVPDAPEFLGREPRGHLRAWARAVADAGADLIVGHGPHVLRGLEWRGRTLIAYSLGNFATYKGFNLKGVTGLTAVLQVTFPQDGAPPRATLLPFRQTTGGQPVPDTTGEVLALVQRLTAADFPGTGARPGPDGTILPPGATHE